MSNDTRDHPFEGFSIPNGTQVPDIVFDELLVRLSGAELKVLMYIIRRTLGFRRDGDNISLSQMLTGIRKRDGTVLDRGTGLSKKTLLTAINSLEEQGYILTQRRRSAEKGDEPTAYRLHLKTHPFIPPPTNEETTPPVGEKLHQGGGVDITPGPWGKNSATQQTGIQVTGRQQVQGDSQSFPIFRDLSPSNFERAIAQRTQNKDETEDQPDPSPEASPDRHRGFETLGSVVKRLPHTRTAQPAAPPAPEATVVGMANRPSPRRRSPAEADLRLAIRPYLEQYAEEFGDEAPLSSTVTQAVHLYEESGLTIDGFIQQLQQAHRETLRRSSSIHKRRTNGQPGPAKNKMPFYFAVLRDYLGLKEHTEPVIAPTSTRLQPAAPAPQQPRPRTVGGSLVPIIQRAEPSPMADRSTSTLPDSFSAPMAPSNGLKASRRRGRPVGESEPSGDF
jgi:hypothetical protein